MVRGYIEDSKSAIDIFYFYKGSVTEGSVMSIVYKSPAGRINPWPAGHGGLGDVYGMAISPPAGVRGRLQLF
jgi:hypothetical protein